MSYAQSAALQAAVYDRLITDSVLPTLVGGAIYDAMPAGVVPATYVALGPEEVEDASDISGAGAVHDLTVSVVTTESGFATAKTAAGAISDALDGAALTLARGSLIAIGFRKARAVRAENGGARRIDMTFRARVALN